MAADSETPDDANDPRPPKTQADFFLRAGEKVKAKFPDAQKEVALGFGWLRVACIVGSLGICGHGESIVGRIEGKD